MTGRIRAVLFVVAGCLATAAATIREIVGDLPVVSIAERSAAPQSFAALHGVEEIRPNIVIVVTGTESHYERLPRSNVEFNTTVFTDLH